MYFPCVLIKWSVFIKCLAKYYSLFINGPVFRVIARLTRTYFCVIPYRVESRLHTFFFLCFCSVHLNYIYRCPTRCNNAQYIFFISLQKLLYMFRVPITPNIKSTGNCSRRPLVQVICRDRLEGAASNPLESTHSQATTTLHHDQVNLTVVECTPVLLMMGVKGTRNM
jgi:hypothetical protein